MKTPSKVQLENAEIRRVEADSRASNGTLSSKLIELESVCDEPQRPMRVAVGIATVGRPQVLSATLDRLSRQTRQPDAIIVCSPSANDVRGTTNSYPQVTFLQGPRGSSHQRNVIIRHLMHFDVVVFFDDDFVACENYIENLEKIMIAQPDIVLTTGHVLEDGILGPGLSFEHADDVIAASENVRIQAVSLDEVFNGYGCNMAVRLAPVHENDLAFDESLPLYAWLEDVDFSRQLALYGRIVKSDATCGVHLGIKTGRQCGVRLGYSQIANPVFLIRKGTCTWKKGLFLMSRNLAANLVRSFRPEPWIDRGGRLRGNVKAIRDLLFGRLRPNRVLSF